MGRKEDYKLQNERYLEALRAENDIRELPCGILYRVLEEGNGGNTPRLNSIVTVHYKGTLINGREFDNSWKRNYPEAFRLNEVIEGWQIALQRMHVGDHWIVYIPYAMGYGTRSSGPNYENTDYQRKSPQARTYLENAAIDGNGSPGEWGRSYRD